ncbi:hypothetical protein VAE308_180018 [Vibrio aestuarianus]|uniref:hypothetical protein n=1 Tax=Vibrio aestuarianus TaxID=28171 RepID=UPI001455FB96|nr:hypothetical protein [Vibrio aestuarianus]NLS56559.1 hypothetical protein [Vibrio aestuarianus subsp. francensis]CAH8231983.1 hypothetical protein VAE308_180018 [Vibrio aestuarianus]
MKDNKVKENGKEFIIERNDIQFFYDDIKNVYSLSISYTETNNDIEWTVDCDFEMPEDRTTDFYPEISNEDDCELRRSVDNVLGLEVHEDDMAETYYAVRDTSFDDMSEFIEENILNKCYENQKLVNEPIFFATEDSFHALVVCSSDFSDDMNRETIQNGYSVWDGETTPNIIKDSDYGLYFAKYKDITTGAVFNTQRGYEIDYLDNDWGINETDIVEEFDLSSFNDSNVKDEEEYLDIFCEVVDKHIDNDCCNKIKLGKCHNINDVLNDKKNQVVEQEQEQEQEQEEVVESKQSRKSGLRR